MSHKYGLNGNDLEWSFLEGICPVCTAGCKGEEDECDGHTMKYSGRGWAIYHDTNGNFVGTAGSVPFAAFTYDYLQEVFEDDYTSASKKARIRKELKNRN